MLFTVCIFSRRKQGWQWCTQLVDLQASNLRKSLYIWNLTNIRGFPRRDQPTNFSTRKIQKTFTWQTHKKALNYLTIKLCYTTEILDPSGLIYTGLISMEKLKGTLEKRYKNTLAINDRFKKERIKRRWNRCSYDLTWLYG